MAGISCDRCGNVTAEIAPWNGEWVCGGCLPDDVKESIFWVESHDVDVETFEAFIKEELA